MDTVTLLKEIGAMKYQLDSALFALECVITGKEAAREIAEYTHAYLVKFGRDPMEVL